MRNFFGVLKSSLNHQPPIFTFVPVGLYSSTLSVGGGVSVCDKTSLTRIGATSCGAGSLAPGPPPTPLLGRHWDLLFHAPGKALSSTATSEKPRPSVTGD